MVCLTYTPTIVRPNKSFINTITKGINNSWTVYLKEYFVTVSFGFMVKIKFLLVIFSPLQTMTTQPQKNKNKTCDQCSVLLKIYRHALIFSTLKSKFYNDFCSYSLAKRTVIFTFSV